MAYNILHELYAHRRYIERNGVTIKKEEKEEEVHGVNILFPIFLNS